MKEFDALLKTVQDAQADVAKVAAGNHAAGVRLRKAMQDAKSLAQQVRVASLGKTAKSDVEAAVAKVGREIGAGTPDPVPAETDDDEDDD